MTMMPMKMFLGDVVIWLSSLCQLNVVLCNQSFNSYCRKLWMRILRFFIYRAAFLEREKRAHSNHQVGSYSAGILEMIFVFLQC
jgi:hypothetical protein